MSVKTATRPARQAKADEMELGDDFMKEVAEFFHERVRSDKVKHYKFETSKDGYPVIPSDWPEELVEAWEL